MFDDRSKKCGANKYLMNLNRSIGCLDCRLALAIGLSRQRHNAKWTARFELHPAVIGNYKVDKFAVVFHDRINCTTTLMHKRCWILHQWSSRPVLIMDHASKCVKVDLKREEKPRVTSNRKLRNVVVNYNKTSPTDQLSSDWCASRVSGGCCWRCTIFFLNINNLVKSNYVCVVW